jgi:hypothetical protein
MLANPVTEAQLMILDSLAQSHDAGYGHGLAVGIGVGLFIGAAIGLFVAALLAAAHDSAPDPAIAPASLPPRLPRPIASRSLTLIPPTYSHVHSDSTPAARVPGVRAADALPLDHRGDDHRA